MPIAFTAEQRKQALASLRRFTDQELELELSDIQLAQLLEYLLQEIAPTAFNAGVAASEAFLRDRLADLEASVHEGEFTYWAKGATRRGTGR